ncbi:hypothetical protein [uncultured Muribaculum sp.]|uniref:hypothetical protein n=1 Tax=uncultured Muribaculum sp. TaxID=1918613 RepID=UPI0025AED6A4|nr:hypothetical protein [uncultured Muribaculum sp.]
MSKRPKNMYTTVDKLKASVLVVAMVLFMACSHSLWDDLPQPISMFITTYYPNSSISSFDETDNGYKVVVKSGPTMYFDSDYKWTEVNGNGVPLPSIFIYNELPRIYDFLLERDEAAGVFKVENNPRSVILTLADRAWEYIKENGQMRPYIVDK